MSFFPKTKMTLLTVSLLTLMNNPVAAQRKARIAVGLLEAAPTGVSVVASYEGFDRGSGNTSLSYERSDAYKWSKGSPYLSESWGYFTQEGIEIPYMKRDRDLGQTFTFQAPAPAMLQAITIRTGFGTNVIRPNTYGKPLSLQLFEVSGQARLNTNGTEGATPALHGYPHDRYTQKISVERDDFLEEEKSRSLGVWSGGVFPSKTAWGVSEEDSIPPTHPDIKGRYLRFVFPEGKTIQLQPGRQYAFLIMFDNPHPNCGFTLANNYYGSYEGGHGIRRDGNGTFPPSPADPTKGFYDKANREARKSAHFPRSFRKRTRIQPGTNGYPDVDTWRDLVFYVEIR